MREQSSMTALISAFARWYHSQYNGVKVFDDTAVGILLTEEEKSTIAAHMSQGIGFFNPEFKGTEVDALRWIVDYQLSPSPLGRAAFAEWHLQRATRLKAKQYVILAAGLDSFAYRQPIWARNLQIFEIDHPVSAEDKLRRLDCAGIATPSNVQYVSADFLDENWTQALLSAPAFKRDAPTFCSMLGISYYLPQVRFEEIIKSLSALLPSKSSIVFDYHDENTFTNSAGERTKKQTALAEEAQEAMLAGYSFADMEGLLEQYGFLTYEHIVPTEITRQWFSKYNQENPEHPLSAFDNINYCLAVKE